MSEEEMKALVEMNNMLKAKLEQQTKVYQQSLQEMQNEVDDLQRNCDVFNEQMNDAVERATELQTELDNLQSNYDRIKEAYEYRIELMQNNEKMLLTEIDKYKTRYNGVFSRQTILDTLEATRDKLRRYNELSPIEQLKQDHTEEYYKGAIQAFILVLSHKEEREMDLQRR